MSAKETLLLLAGLSIAVLWLVALPLWLLLLIGVLPLLVGLWIVYAICLNIVIWVQWCKRGKDILFVYSDSPIWHDYLDERVLPHLGDRAIVLNWSHRKTWNESLATAAFRHFGGDKEFNPLAVVFRPFRRARTFRFWQPFRDFKHGKTEPLARLESEFFELIGVTSRSFIP